MSFHVKEGKKGSGLAAKKKLEKNKTTYFKLVMIALELLKNYLIGSVYLVNSSQKHSNDPLHVTG